jgi:hypothetical protein
VDRDALPKLAIPLLVVLLVSTTAGLVRIQSTAGLKERSGLVRGWDFQQFYVSGLMLIRGRADGLYDPELFQATQRAVLPVDEQNIPFLPLYPPTTALLVAPLALLPYPVALAVWWPLNVACFAVAGWMLVRWCDVSAAWRWTLVLAIASYYPFIMSFRAGQLSPLLLLVTLTALTLVRRQRQVAGGLILSLLALKPQFAAGMILWFLLRRDLRVLSGILVGVVLQMVIVAVLLQPAIIADYLWSTSVYLQHSQIYDFPDGWVHSLAGTLQNMLGRLGYVGAGCGNGCKAVHVAVLLIAAAGVASWSWRSRDQNKQQCDSPCGWQCEQAAAVVFTLLFTPHLLLYDLLLLLVPIVYLLETSRWRQALAIYLATSALVMPVYAWGDVSLVPFVLVAVLYRLLRHGHRTDSAGVHTHERGSRICLSVSGNSL